MNLSWDTIEGASKYEIGVERDGATEVQLLLDRPEWHGDLGFGLHVYRIRAIDLAGRAGAWSQPNPLVVSPTQILLLSPENTKFLEVLQGQSIRFEWQKIEGVNNFVFELRKLDEVIFTTDVSGTEYRVANLSPGKYSWQVTGVISAGSFYPSLAGRKWSTVSSAPFDLTVQRKVLATPKLLYPIGEVWPSNDGQLEFRWGPIKDAVAYEIHVKKKAVADQLKNADDVNKIFRTETNSAIIRVGVTGQFEWSIKAFAEGATPQLTAKSNVTAEPEAASEASGEFSLESVNVFVPKGNEITFRGGYKDMSVQFTDYGRNIYGSVDSSAFFFGLDVRHWFEKSWSLSSSAEATFLRFDSDVAILRFDGLILARADLGYGWVYDYWAGPEYREIPLLAPVNGGASTIISNLNMFDFSVGNSIVKTINTTWSARGQLRLFYPISLISGQGGSTLSPSSRSLNYSAAASAFYAYNQKTTFIYSLGWESQKVQLVSPKGSSSDQEAAYSALAIGMSIAHRF